MTNVEIITQGYANFAAGNVPAVLANFDPAIEWKAAKGAPYITGDGVFIGHDAIVQNVFMHIPEYYDGFTIDVQGLFGDGDKVAMYGLYKGILKETGKPVEANATHIWTLKNGKVTHFFQAVDTISMNKK